MKRILYVIGIGIALALSQQAQAESGYPLDLTPSLMLPPPPADTTAAAKAELAELRAIETAREPARLARAKADAQTQDASIFADALGSGFDLAKLPATAKMLADVHATEQSIVGLAKLQFKRNRPWIADAGLHPCSTDEQPQSSYPSGHATLAYSMAVVLARLAPEKSGAILARAADYAESRLVCGMHFRRDIVAGQVLGTAVALEMLNNKAFLAQVDAATKELRAARVIPQ